MLSTAVSPGPRMAEGLKSSLVTHGRLVLRKSSLYKGVYQQFTRDLPRARKLAGTISHCMMGKGHVILFPTEDFTIISDYFSDISEVLCSSYMKCCFAGRKGSHNSWKCPLLKWTRPRRLSPFFCSTEIKSKLLSLNCTNIDFWFVSDMFCLPSLCSNSRSLFDYGLIPEWQIIKELNRVFNTNNYSSVTLLVVHQLL